VLVKAATVVGSIAGSGFAMMASSPLAFLILAPIMLAVIVLFTVT
jgi:hypothetical protein